MRHASPAAINNHYASIGRFAEAFNVRPRLIANFEILFCFIVSNIIYKCLINNFALTTKINEMVIDQND